MIVSNLLLDYPKVLFLYGWLCVWRVVLWYYYTSIVKGHYSVLYNLVPHNYSFMLCSLSSSQLFYLMLVGYLNPCSRDVMYSDLWNGLWCGATGVPSITDTKPNLRDLLIDNAPSGKNQLFNSLHVWTSVYNVNI